MPSSVEADSAALAAVIAHELNNIAVPLRGFIELALDKTARDEAVLQCIDEVRVGLDRIAALAFDLASLAPDESTSARVRLDACLEPVDSRGPARRPPATWACNPQLTVVVDLNQARRAVASLTSLAMDAGLVLEEVSTAHVPTASPSCAACGSPLPRRKAFVRVRSHGLRTAVLQAVPSPFDATHKLRGTERLAIAALVRSTHRAGGHVLVDVSAEDLSLVLPQTAASPSSSRSGPR